MHVKWLNLTRWCWVAPHNQDVTWTAPQHQSTQLPPIENDEGQLQNPMCDQSQITHLWLFDTALLERAAAWVVSACVTVFAPVTLVWASNTGQTSGTKKITTLWVFLKTEITLLHVPVSIQRYSRFVNAAVVEDKASIGKSQSCLLWLEVELDNLMVT